VFSLQALSVLPLSCEIVARQLVVGARTSMNLVCYRPMVITQNGNIKACHRVTLNT
jgi:hypothetical protein